MFDFKRPRKTTDNHKLFYVDKHENNNPRFRVAAPQNILIQLKLYQWCMSENYHSPVKKSELVKSLFGDIAPDVTTNAVGRIMARIVTYKTHLQVNANRENFQENQMFWRFFHQLDIRFGLEFLIFIWLPELVALEGDTIKTWDEFEEELDIIINSENGKLLEIYFRPAMRNQSQLYVL